MGFIRSFSILLETIKTSSNSCLLSSLVNQQLNLNFFTTTTCETLFCCRHDKIHVLLVVLAWCQYAFLLAMSFCHTMPLSCYDVMLHIIFWFAFRFDYNECALVVIIVCALTSPNFRFF